MKTDCYFLYGPPGSGKSLLGNRLAESLSLPFADLDAVVEAETGRRISDLFAAEGETGFRRRESLALRSTLRNQAGVLALGGGTLLDPANRRLVEQSGSILCLDAPLATLVERLARPGPSRPLLQGDLQQQLEDLLVARAGHYASFENRLLADGTDPPVLVRQAQRQLGAFRLSAMGAGYDVRILHGGLEALGEAMLHRGLKGPLVLVSDENVGRLYAEKVMRNLSRAGYTASIHLLPAGETHKSLASLQRLWQAFLAGGLDRSSTVVALGGGVVSDLAGFAAATYMRGIHWVCVPTSLIGMVDASLGGKTGIDLPEVKNLAGAFHPPGLVLVDPGLLKSLPEAELRSGLAEVVKHGLIAGGELLEACRSGLDSLNSDWTSTIRRAAAVKIDLVEQDPFEQGPRAALNLGHTLGHALEQVSGYRIRHGEAVALGMVYAVRLSIAAGLAGEELLWDTRSILRHLGLPVDLPAGIDRQRLLAAMRHDKKRRDGRSRFVLLARPGDIRWRQEIDEELVRAVLEEL